MGEWDESMGHAADHVMRKKLERRVDDLELALETRERHYLTMQDKYFDAFSNWQKAQCRVNRLLSACHRALATLRKWPIQHAAVPILKRALTDVAQQGGDNDGDE